MTRPPSDTDALAPTTPTSAATETDGNAPKRESEPLRPSGRIGERYQLEGLLGKGGMGAVYRARDEALGGQPVALKLVAGDVTNDPAELKRLRDEVVLAQKVTHPAVCRTYDLEQIDGLWLIKMEVVEGESLAHRLKRVGKLPIAEVERIATWITRGLAAAHRQGVIHRDLKPQNVMIERDSKRIVLMDFGIARRESASRNSNIEIVGTPDYMAPEQARGEAIDGRADLYALGCVIYEMLTGSRPYATKTAIAAALENLDEPPPDPRVKRPDTPRYLAAIVRALLEKDREKRPKDAAAVVAMASRRPLRMWLLGGAIVAVAATAAVIAWFAARPHRAASVQWQPELVEVQPRVDENLGELAISPDGTKISFDSDRDQRNATFRIYVGPIDSNEAKAISPAALPMLSAGFAGSDAIYAEDDLEQTSYRVPIGGGEPEKLGFKGLPSPCGAGRLMVQIYDEDGASRFVLREAGKPDRVVVELRPPNINVGTWHCSPDATRLVYAVMTSGSLLSPHSDLWEVAVAGGAPRQLTNDGKRNEDPSFTPDGSIVFTSSRGGAANIWELPVNGGPPRQITHGSGDDLEPVVTPDGKRLVFAVDSTTSVIRSYGNAPSQRVTTVRDFYSSPIVSPDGRELIAVTAHTDSITAVTVADGTVHTVVKRSADGAPTTVAITPDGATLAFSTRSEVFTMPRAGGAAKRIAKLDGEVRILQIGGDGALHAELQAPSRQEAWRIPLDGTAPAREGGDETGFVLPSAAGWTLVFEPAPPRRPRPAKLIPKGAKPDDKRVVTLTVALADWSRDGNVLAYFDGTKVHRYDARTGADRIVASPSDTQPWIALSPDGETVYVFALEGFVRRTIITNFADRPR